MTGHELMMRAQSLCRRLRRPVPAELGGYASHWQRQGFDLGFCSSTVRRALKEGRAMWMVDAEIRRHYAGIQAATEAKERSLCPPLLPSSTAPQKPSQGSLQAASLYQTSIPRRMTTSAKPIFGLRFTTRLKYPRLLDRTSRRLLPHTRRRQPVGAALGCLARLSG